MPDALKPNKKYGHLYAIIRHDAGSVAPIDLQVTVKKVVSDPLYAAREVERLNELNSEKGCYYFHQITRFEEVPVEVRDRAALQSSATEAPQG
jgi:hypothetical protein